LFDQVWIDTDGDRSFSEEECVAFSGHEGIGLVDERGVLYTTSARPPESVRIEETGGERAVIRVEGKYANQNSQYMRYVTRLTFRAGSTRVQIDHTHINDYLETEFTDITSLYIPIECAGTISQATVFTGDQKHGLQAHSSESGIRLFQGDEKTAILDGKTVMRRPFWTPGMSPGVVRLANPNGTIVAAIHEFQERWPKGIAVDGTRLSLELFPEQPDTNFGTDLPYHLMFPFVSGKYRFKWGNAFTERITIDFAGTTPPEEMAAASLSPIVAVVPAAWYNETRVLGPIAPTMGERMVLWDDFVTKSYGAHIDRKVAYREFGYFNYGDWFGERGRNWGNNEYDLAHCFFMEFIRTGNRDYFRLALAAARHQADVDIVHAYPEPSFIGCNPEHSVGHTGAWDQNLPQATWSKAFDNSSIASNGHTWADGMMDAWFLTGDPRIMEAALALGEHITWAMAPHFGPLGTHERSAGWSLKAIMAIYRGTYDPMYAMAARRIVDVVLGEQDLEGSGVWPHRLPTGQFADRPGGAVGNNLFMMSILLAGLQSYHEETGDADVLESLEAGVEWIANLWDPSRQGWPYTATVDGEPLYEADTVFNSLLASAVSYVGAIRQDHRLLQMADDAMIAYIRPGAKKDGKSIAMALHYSSGILARLSEWAVPLWLHVDGIGEGNRLRGQVPMSFQVMAEDPESFVEISIAVDGREVLRSSDLRAGESFVLDTVSLEDDNPHELTVTVLDRNQGLISKSIPFRVRNGWSIVDELKAPVVIFGLPMERLRVTDKSEGWRHVEDHPELFFDDNDRLTRAGQSNEYLIWETPMLQKCEVILFSPSGPPEGSVLFAVSEDGTQWQEVPHQVSVADTSPEGIHRVSFRPSIPTETAFHWLRLSLTEKLAFEAQLGEVTMTGLITDK
jgi:hypothetical protein